MISKYMLQADRRGECNRKGKEREKNRLGYNLLHAEVWAVPTKDT